MPAALLTAALPQTIRNISMSMDTLTELDNAGAIGALVPFLSHPAVVRSLTQRVLHGTCRLTRVLCLSL